MTLHQYTIRFFYLLILIAISMVCFNFSNTPNKIVALNAREKAAYINQLEIYDFFAERIELTDGHRQPAIWFRLRNNSKTTFHSVKVKISFFDRKQNLIHESFFHPVHQNTLFRYAIPLLRPDEIWQMAHTSYYVPTNIPNHWVSGNATVEIVDVIVLSD